MTLILVFLFSLFIGISLGLIGGGGSILTVPVFVYVLGVNPILATAYSLFVVGVSSAVGAFRYALRGLVSFKTSIIFAIPAFVSVYFTRAFLLPALPNVFFIIKGFEVTKSIAIMLFFGLLMLFAAISMLKPKKDENNDSDIQAIQYNYPFIAIEGIVVGLVTGIVGAGGGFLIIPALVLLARLPMKLAVGTSLFIIAFKSLVGFVGDIQAGQVIDWPLLLGFTVFSVLGIFIGSYLSRYISGQKLKRIFAFFVLAMAVFILTKELFL